MGHKSNLIFEHIFDVCKICETHVTCIRAHDYSKILTVYIHVYAENIFEKVHQKGLHS